MSGAAMPYQATEGTEATKMRRRHALLAAATAVVAEHGFQLATVKSVAAVAGMSVGSVYLFFPTKIELLAAVFRLAADAELAAVRAAVCDARTTAARSHADALADANALADTNSQTSAETGALTAAAELTALVECFAQRAIKGRRLAWSLLLEPVDRTIDVERLVYRKSYADLVADILERGILRGELAQQNLELSSAAIVGAISEALTGPLSPLRGIDAAFTDTVPSETVTSDTPQDDEVIATITALCLRAVGAFEPAAVLVGKASS